MIITDVKSVKDMSDRKLGIVQLLIELDNAYSVGIINTGSDSGLYNVSVYKNGHCTMLEHDDFLEPQKEEGVRRLIKYLNTL